VTVCNWFENKRVPRHCVRSLVRDRGAKRTQNFPMHANETFPRAARNLRVVAILFATLRTSCASEGISRAAFATARTARELRAKRTAQTTVESERLNGLAARRPDPAALWHATR
jgi:hypothetical protein